MGLNLKGAITQKVALKGFNSLFAAERGKLDEVAYRVDKTYMALTRRAHGAHAHGSLYSTNFCEAQLVWDNIMAINAIELFENNPAHIMVVLTGNSHTWKGGVPAQIKK